MENLPNTTAPRGEMSLMEHLTELRRRLVISFAAIVGGALVAYSFSTPIFALLTAPYFKSFPKDILIGTGPAEAIILKLKMACFGGILIACPVIFYQLWLFIAPGLHASEKKLAAPFVGCTTLLFLTGVVFCYYGVFPFAFGFFAEQYESIGLTPTIRMSEHLALMVQALLGFGFIFELPMLAFFLGRMGLITHRTLISGWRYAVIIIFVVAAVFTPPDVFTQFLMAGPLLLLYGLSILIVKYTEKKTPAE